MNLPDSNESTAAARLADARLKQWHQQGEALLTIENARSFLNAAGLVLFAPRPQIAAPAPSFVEAVIGASNATPSLSQIGQAREMLARLVAEGLAVPLNLLGVGSVIGQAGDAPDFIASAQVFSYIFSLRGDKAWKQPPEATGAVRFSHLAVATHEALTRRGPMTAFELVTELGKEVTEGAVLRALGELWTHLRVLPVLQPDGRPTVWELASTRLVKQMKAGGNAGLPTALSALISLYLGQVAVASEDEIESFLSPLAARSRIRDVVHALVAARQLDTVAIEGKTMLYVAGTELAFLEEQMPTAANAVEGIDAGGSGAGEDATHEAVVVEGEERGQIEAAEPGSRIARFVPRKKPATRDLAKARPAKFARKPFAGERKPLGGERKPFGDKKPFAPRERKNKPAFGNGESRPPFRDGKKARPFGERRGVRPAGEGTRERKVPFQPEGRPRFEKKSFARGPEFKPRFEKREREGGKPDRERRPFVRREGSEERPRKSFDRAEGVDRRPRKPFDRSREDRPARRPFDRSAEGRPPRKPPFGRAAGSGRGERKPFERRVERPAGRKPPFGKPGGFGRAKEFGSGEGRPERGFKPKPFGKAKPFGRRAESGDETKGGGGGFRDRKPFAKPGGFAKPFRGKEPSEDARPGRSGGARPSGAGFGAKKFGGARSSGAGFGAKKFGGAKFGGAKSGGPRFGGGQKFGGKKFGDKKPFGKPKGERKPKSSQDDQEA